MDLWEQEEKALREGAEGVEWEEVHYAQVYGLHYDYIVNEFRYVNRG